MTTARPDVIRLARAVVRAGGKALLINPDNTSGEWVPIPEAADRAFAVEIKPGLIVLDLDTPELVEKGERGRKLCEDSGLATLTVASGREGHRHLYVNAGTQVPAVTEHLRSEGIPPSAFRRSVRPPLARHRNGLETALISPETVEQALEVLGPPAEYRPLSDAAISMIENGDTTGRFNGSRSAMALSIAANMRLAGCTLDQFRAAMLNRTNKGGAKAQELEDQGRDVQAFLVRTWDKAANAETFVPDSVDVTRALAAVEAAAWPGRTGNTDRAVMLSLCRLGLEHGTTAPTFGERCLTELAGLGSRSTTRKALSRLVAAGWLIRVTNGPGLADAYRIVCETDPPNTVPPGVIGGSLLHTAFRDGSGLGRSAGRVWEYLRQHGSQAVPALVTGTGRHRTTVQRALCRLVAYGLAERDRTGDQWRAIGNTDLLDIIAIETGAADKAARQARNHDVERLLYRSGSKRPCPPAADMIGNPR